MSRLASAALLFALGGCAGGTGPAPPDTGARAAAEAFYGALIVGDPPRAYATLDPDSKQRVSADRFAVLARAYAKNMGFPARKVHVHASEERGDHATAHVTLSGHSAGHARRYNDAAVLRRDADRWCVILSSHFGQKAR